MRSRERGGETGEREDEDVVRQAFHPPLLRLPAAPRSPLLYKVEDRHSELGQSIYSHTPTHTHSHISISTFHRARRLFLFSFFLRADQCLAAVTRQYIKLIWLNETPPCFYMCCVRLLQAVTVACSRALMSRCRRSSVHPANGCGSQRGKKVLKISCVSLN